VFKNLRIDIFNWFAAGKLTLTKEKPQEYNLMSQSTYTLGGSGGYGGITINPASPQMNVPVNLTIRIASANGGTVVSVINGDLGSADNLYIIPDDADFDRELGKIITMNKLKS
jgi:hypothetical protein